jgi:hypothetical protein
MPAPALAAGTLSDGSVTPTSGTTSTPFTFTVSYVSTDSPSRPAQSVWAQVGAVSVPLVKVSGSAHDGTWQASATLPAGVWPVTFHATTADDPALVLPGPIVTVTAPPPTPTPVPTLPPTPRPPTPRPTAPPTVRPTASAIRTTAPTPVDDPAAPTVAPSERDADRSPSARAGQSAGSSSSAAESASSDAQPDRSGGADLEPSAARETPDASDVEVENAASGGSTGMLASFLIVGGSMSLGGAAILTRQWLVSRRTRQG